MWWISLHRMAVQAKNNVTVTENQNMVRGYNGARPRTVFPLREIPIRLCAFWRLNETCFSRAQMPAINVLVFP